MNVNDDDNEKLRFVAYATCNFVAGNYEQCAHGLKELPNHPKVKHNAALVQYYSGGGTLRARQRTLQEKLENLQEAPVLQFNLAVLHFHQRRYREALAMLLKVLDCAVVEENVAINACFLFLEVCLRLKELDKEGLQKAIALLPTIHRGAYR